MFVDCTEMLSEQSRDVDIQCCQRVVQVFRHFVPRLRDQNTKVSLQAQQAFQQMLPAIATFNGLFAVIGLIVETVCYTLKSRNIQLRKSASSVLDAIIEYIGNDGKCCLLLKLMKIVHMYFLVQYQSFTYTEYY